MKKVPLKVKDLNKELANYNLNYNKKDKIILVDDNYKIILVNNKPHFFYYQNNLLPTLKLLQTEKLLKKVTVDMGAVKFVINGADIMRPGITEIEHSFQKDEFIVIIDINNKKPLAIGQALLNSEDMQDETKGKVIKNIHYVGDDIWNLK